MSKKNKKLKKQKKSEAHDITTSLRERKSKRKIHKKQIFDNSYIIEKKNIQDKKSAKKSSTKNKKYENFASTDRPIVDYGIIDKKNYKVIEKENPTNNDDKYYSTTLFYKNPNGEIKKFFVVQLLQNKKTLRYTTYNREGTFPSYGKGWRFDVYSYEDGIKDYKETVNKYKNVGYEEINLIKSNYVKPRKTSKTKSTKKESKSSKKEKKIIEDEEDQVPKMQVDTENNFTSDIGNTYNDFSKEETNKLATREKTKFKNKNNSETKKHIDNYTFLNKELDGKARKKSDANNRDIEKMCFTNPSAGIFTEENLEEEEDDDQNKSDEMTNNEDEVKGQRLTLKEEKKRKEKIEKINGVQKPVVKLIKLIFDLKEAKKHLSFIGLDLTSLPLSKISDEKFINSYNKLSEIEQQITSIDNSKSRTKLFHLSKEYYRIIPHIFNANSINEFTIDSTFKIQKEICLIELLRSVSELEAQINSLISANSKKDNFDNENEFMIKELNSLHFNINLVSTTQKDYDDIENYLNLYSKGSKDTYPKLKLSKLFKLEKKREYISDSQGNQNRGTLLWYGCEIAHFYSILKDGLKLPSKEIPNSPYIYGKGIMLSTNAFEQAQKCFSRNRTGLILGCMVDVSYADEVNDNSGFELIKKNKRDCTIIRINRHFIKNIYDEGKAYITYHNYIVYDTSKINISYIAKIKLPSFS